MTTLYTLRDRAIEYRLSAISSDESRVFRGCDEMDAEESTAHNRYWINRYRAEIMTLRSMPIDVDDDAVRTAMAAS